MSITSSREQTHRRELRRQVFHIIVGVLAAILIHQGHLTAFFLFAILVVGMIVSASSRVARLPVFSDLLDIFDRPEDRNAFPGKGVIMMLFGMFLAVLIFPRSIAAASVLILGVGDSLATVVGQRFGKRRIFFNKRKMLEGTLAGTLFAALAASLIVPWPIAYLGSFIGMLAEALDIIVLDRRIDDNILIPLVSGAAMWLLWAYAPAALW